MNITIHVFFLRIFSLQKIMNTVHGICSITKNAEITLEMNPTPQESLKLKDFASAGINRVSLGIQVCLSLIYRFYCTYIYIFLSFEGTIKILKQWKADSGKWLSSTHGRATLDNLGAVPCGVISICLTTSVCIENWCKHEFILECSCPIHIL